VALLGGHPADALTTLGEPSISPDSMLPDLLAFPGADARWLRAEALRELGRDDEALRWYATFPDPAGYDLHYVAAAHLRRAGIHQKRGESEQAVEHYAGFPELWRDADPQVQPMLEEARRSLARLRAGRVTQPRVERKQVG
jgi:hypothetical protein